LPKGKKEKDFNSDTYGGIARIADFEQAKTKWGSRVESESGGATAIRGKNITVKKKECFQVKGGRIGGKGSCAKSLRGGKSRERGKPTG